jgi:DNA-binding transcriptional LysR family regulator
LSKPQTWAACRQRAASWDCPRRQPARLTKLEATLNTRLFERSTRHLRLTEEGSLYLQHCQQALQALDDAHAALQAGSSVVRGKVRISATSDFGRNVLKGWLDEFGRLYPEVTFGLMLSDTLSNLMQDDIDLAIRFGVPPDSSMVARYLAANRRVLCASPHYLAAHGSPTRPRDLERFDCILLNTSAGLSGDWRFARGDEVETHAVATGTSRETNDGAIARAWAVDGCGIALKSLWDIGADLLAGRLMLVMPEWRAPEAPVHALFQRSRYMPTRVRALLQFLVERFATASAELEGLATPGEASWTGK